jgi:TetR/AcrR family transcriptional regulator, regulator of autoinduction and epiphytic fitness
MERRVKPRRAYDSSRRQEQARVTRRSVLEAARTLFAERGYVATTVDGIAEGAGVSAETIYATFGSKRAVLTALVDHAIAGSAEAPAVRDQAWVEQLRAERDPRRRMRILARNGTAILERRADIDEVVRAAAAAEPDIAALWARGKEERFAGQRALLEIVVGDGILARGLDLDAAADILYAVGSPETFRLLVVDRGWNVSRFERWYGETLERLLLDG